MFQHKFFINPHEPFPPPLELPLLVPLHLRLPGAGSPDQGAPPARGGRIRLREQEHQSGVVLIELGTGQGPLESLKLLRGRESSSVLKVDTSLVIATHGVLERESPGGGGLSDRSQTERAGLSSLHHALLIGLNLLTDHSTVWRFPPCSVG